MRVAWTGSSVLDRYACRSNPRTDLKIGHYKIQPKSRAKPRSGPPQKDGPYNSKPKSTVRSDCGTR
jgi:hypothetical protein